MDAVGRILRPITLDIQPTSQDAPRVFKHWKFVLTQYISALPEDSQNLSLGVLAGSLSPNNFELISECRTYEAALQSLTTIFVKPPSDCVARHSLKTRKQLPQESIDEYARELQRLSIDCAFQDVTASTYRNEYIRDSFISGLKSPHVRTRLLEFRELPLESAIDKARALELAHQDAMTYEAPRTLAMVSSPVSSSSTASHEDVEAVALVTTSHKRPCFFCGKRPTHDRAVCPARGALCSSCHKRGHFAKACRSTN